MDIHSKINLRVLLKNAKKDLSWKTKKNEMNNNISISFELNDKQQKLFDEWQNAIRTIYGECGHFKWTISPTGIGNGIEVWSSLTKTTLDLTDTDNW